jgi:hypothetical protein
MIQFIALASAVFLFTIMVVCAFAGKPARDALDEIQQEDAK